MSLLSGPRRALLGGNPKAWWDPAGLGLCIAAAYNPKGAVSYAASKVNLARPGTYDITEGTAPTWAAGTGWTFNGVDEYLKTGWRPDDQTQTQSMIVRFTNSELATRYIAGLYIAATTSFTLSAFYGAQVRFANGNQVISGATFTAGILAVAGNQGYKNGVPQGNPIATGGSFASRDVWIARPNSAATYWSGVLQALAVYDCTLTAPQVSAVTTAMAAL